MEGGGLEKVVVEDEENWLHNILICFKCGAMSRIEMYFKWHGRIVARHPYIVMFLSLLVTVLFGLGLATFREETEMTALWVPKGSKFRNDFHWVEDNFPRQLRISQAIFQADNVLEPKVLQEMLKLRKRVETINTDGLTWQDVCVRIPIIQKPKCLDQFSLFDSFFGKKRRRRSIETEGGMDFDFGDDDAWDSENMTQAPVDPECEGVDPPDLSKVSMADLLHIKSKMDSEGFTVDLAKEVSRVFYPEPYCNFVKSAPTICFEDSLLELWASEGELEDSALDDLTLEDVVDAVNSRNTSGLFMTEKNFLRGLGEKVYNSSGAVVGAREATLTWVGRVNLTALEMYGSVQRGETVDKWSFAFEGEMIKVTTNRTDLAEEVQTYIIVARMFFETLENLAFKDAGMLLVGYLIVFTYVFLMLGKCNLVQQRFWLSLGGIFGVLMGLVVSYGICSMMGFFYSAAHTVMPFLLLGIGIDDMFVITQCRNTLTDSVKALSVEDRLGTTMAQAGVAITITSITDFIAFGIGASTILPALRSFCMFAAVGILSIFFFQSTWFCALLAVDEYRVEGKRDGCLCCIVHPTQEVREDKAAGRITVAFSSFANMLSKPPAKAAVIGVTLVTLGLGLWGTLLLEMEFRPEWLMDPDSEIYRWYRQHKLHFSEEGEAGTLYIKPIDYPANMEKLDSLMMAFERETTVIREIDSWTTKFKEFLESMQPSDEPFLWSSLDSETFHARLSHFLFSPLGAKYRPMFKFSGTLVCGQPAPRILVSSVDYKHFGFDSASEWVPALDRIYELVEESDIRLPGDNATAVFPMGVRYANWVTDKVIQRELYQNIGSSMLAIFLTVLLFLGSFRGALFVIFCVAATIVEVAGFMHFWGLTVDVITCNTLVISIGLCVDFSAHIAHYFLASHGDRNERMIATMTRIGPAVMNGGLSTLLAFILLSTSKSYVFLSFFKIFFLICLFGLFHGLLTLPVLLSIIGPAPNSKKRHMDDALELEETTRLAAGDPLQVTTPDGLGRPSWKGN